MNFGKREKVLISVTLVIAIILGIKSFVLDPIDVSKLNEEELSFLNYVNEQVDEYYSSALYDYHILDIKITEVKKSSMNDGNYMAKGRQYIFSYLPIGNIYIGDDRTLAD